MGKIKDLTGKKFGRLTVMRYIFTRKHCACWECKCVCGNTIIVLGNSLQRRNTQSCGCLRIERLKEKIVKHNMCKTKIYYVWSGVIQRCNNSNNNRYADYGGRGITVCKKWLKFENFRDDMYKSYKEHCNKYGENDTQIDRTDNNKGYLKENCKWSTRKEQQNNTRFNYFLTYKGQSLNITQWAKKLNMKSSTINTRIKRGWSIERTLNTPALTCNQSLQLARAVLGWR